MSKDKYLQMSKSLLQSNLLLVLVSSFSLLCEFGRLVQIQSYIPIQKFCININSNNLSFVFNNPDKDLLTLSILFIQGIFTYCFHPLSLGGPKKLLNNRL